MDKLLLLKQQHTLLVIIALNLIISGCATKFSCLNGVAQSRYSRFEMHKAMYKSNSNQHCYIAGGYEDEDVALATALDHCLKTPAKDCALAALDADSYEKPGRDPAPPANYVAKAISARSQGKARSVFNNIAKPGAAANATAAPVDNQPGENHDLSTENRSALIIGNSKYKFAPVLKNPANDAGDMAAALKKLGFNVTLLENATQRQMDEAIANFGQRLAGGGVGLFFYAGHGAQVAGENYLLPVDANPQSETDVKYKAVNAGQLLSEMGEARNGMNIVILDACRDNPFPRSFRSLRGGLAEMNAPKGSIIAFATSPGSTASDGDGHNGLYTQHILENIDTPDLPIESLFKKVLQGVNASSHGNQVPWTSSSFTGDFYFKQSKP